MGRRSKVTPTHFGRQNQSNSYDFNVLPTTHPFWEGFKTDTIYLENAGNPVCVNIVSDFAARISKLIGQITNIVPARALVPLFVNTVAFDCRFIPSRCVARRANSLGYYLLLAPFDPGASTISVRHRIYEQDHLAWGVPSLHYCFPALLHRLIVNLCSMASACAGAATG